MGKSKAPPPPDYAAAAREQGVANIQAANATSALNKPNQITPDGSQMWSMRPGADPNNPRPGDWTVTSSLSPEQQRLRDLEQAVSSKYGNLAQTALGQLEGTFGSKFDTTAARPLQELTTSGLSPQGTVPTAPTFQNIQQGPGKVFVQSEAAKQLTGPAPDKNLVGMGGPRTLMDSGSGFRQFVINDVQNQMAPSVPSNRASVSTEGLREFASVSPEDQAARQRAEDAMYSRHAGRLDPQFAQERSDLDSRLASQGITSGSSAYERALNNQSRRQAEQYSAARNDAILQGSMEAGRLFGQGLAGTNQTNQIRGQQFNERLGVADFNNRNLDSTFGQGLAAAGFNNAAADQGFNRNLAAAGFNNAARGDLFRERLATTGFNNDVQGQRFREQLDATGFNNLARSQNFQENLASAGFNNDARSRMLQEELARAGFNNSANSQSYLEALQGIGFNNSNAQNAFQSGLAANSAANANRAQQFAEMQATTGQNNDLRARELQELLMARQTGLNEANALRTGNQIMAPQFGQYGGNMVAPAPIYQSTSDAYNAQLNNVNARNAANGQLWNTAGQLGSMWMFSDRRLKTNIRHVGNLSNGLPWYKFTMFGQEAEGVMADEVMQTISSAVRRDKSGYLQVNYSEVLSG